MTHSRPAAYATTVLAVLALLLFARLTLRHVGESYFLADQVDQLQKYEAALRLEPEGLWGPAMSGTAARALGPFGALVFGLPVSLGLGIDAIHAVTSLLLAIATAVAFWQLTRLSPILGWSWLIVFITMRMVWWSAAMFWVNALLLPLGLVIFALFVATLRNPSLVTLAGMALFLVLALQVHLVALVGVPVLLLAAAMVHARSRQPFRPAVHASDRRRTAGVALIVGTVLVALLPYVVAEGRTGFRNTLAMFTHVRTSTHSGSGDGSQAAGQTLVLAADPMALFGEDSSTGLAMGAAITIAAMALLAWPSRGVGHKADMMWLMAAVISGVAGQALFFLLMARPLNGLHYAILLAPWYAVPAAALVAAVVPDGSRSVTTAATALGVVAVLVLLFRAPGLADRFAERTPWNYRTIVTTLDALCGGEGVQTIEGPGLVDELTPAYDSVLRYLMKRGFTRCRYAPDSRIVIAAQRNGAFEESIDVDGHRFTRERVLPPGLARYARVR